MRSQTIGTSTSDIEVTNIDSHGLWLFIKDKEYFLSYEDYPWFKEAKVRDILNVELLHESHVYWPALDVDLTVGILEEPGRYPLMHEESNE